MADPADWCAGHGVPESMCTVCNPELLEHFRSSGDWCVEHGYPESVCPSCNPMEPPGRQEGDGRGDRVGDPADWCAGHGVPESMCTVCNPELLEHFRSSGDWCAEHGYPESVCPSCNPMEPPTQPVRSSVIRSGVRVRFASASIERAAGIETVPASAEAMSITVETTARIDFDRDALADVHSAVPGVVRAVSVDLGEQVDAGAELFVLESAHVGDLQARRIAARARISTARAHLARQERLRRGSIASQRHVELARQELEAASSELRSIEQSLRIGGASRRGRAGSLIVRAPISGSVVRRPALIGTFVGESDSLATIADTSRMWALIDVPEWDAATVRVGQRVEVSVAGVTTRSYAGTVTWIASEVDSRTRAVVARASIENPEGWLRAGQFARAVVHVAAPESAVTVPVASLQRVGDESILFVRVSEGLYEPRVVRPGRSDSRRVQVSGEVREGEDVVTDGAFLLRTELTRESIGAGCCEVDQRSGG